MKKIICIVMCLVMAFTMLAACSQGASPGKSGSTAAYQLSKEGDSTTTPPEIKASKKYKIGVCLPHLANPHFISQAYGYKSEGEKLGVEVIVNEAGGYTKLPVQVQQFEDFVAMGVDAIILVAIDGKGTTGLVDLANEKKIPVINVNVMTENQNVVTRIRSDDATIGRMHAEFMAKKLDGKGKVLMLCGPAGTSWAMGRGDGFQAYMKENCPNIQIVDRRYLDSTPEAGMQEMEDALQAYSDLAGVFTGSDMLGVGAAQAIVAAKLAGKIVVTTSDSQDACLQAIREGSITSTVCQSSVTMGQWGVRAAVAVLEGKSADLMKKYWTPLNLITKENVDTFKYEGISQAPKGWSIK